MVKSFKLIGHGAEAKIYLLQGIKSHNHFEFFLERVIGEDLTVRLPREFVVLKYRYRKKYRHFDLDSKLRRYRTRREAKILQTLSKLSCVPEVEFVDESKGILIMEYIEGLRLSDHLEVLDFEKVMKNLGVLVAKMHSLNVIHGDLTTSNVILRSNKLFFIDFGLSYFSTRIEDFATDIHLLKEALEAKHWRIYESALEAFFEGYSAFEKHKEVLSRLEIIEKRGRYKG
jgi:Kae1-associated kinase Bud32